MTNRNGRKATGTDMNNSRNKNSSSDSTDRNTDKNVNTCVRGVGKRVCILIMALAFAGAVLYALWKEGFFLPSWITWESGMLYEESGNYEIVLHYRSIDVIFENRIIWTSPKGVKVQKAVSCDIDNDGKEELILLCWKRGRFGRHRPFWVREDEKNWSQHIFVYEYVREEIRPGWMSSYIGQDVLDLSVYNRNSGPNVCNYCLLLTGPDGETSCWQWDSWGFTKVDTEVSFIVFGDNLIHEPIYRYGLGQEEAFEFLFRNVKDRIADRDVAVINQETPLVAHPSLYGGYPRFGTPVQVGEAIAEAGFDVVTCATNHALDRGAEGINLTKGFFESSRIMCLGIQSEGEPEYLPYEILVRKGIRFALLNYTYGTNGIRIPDEYPYMVHVLEDEEQIRNDIARAGQEADFVIVFVHWGTENSSEVDDFQKKWTKVFQESKADVVIGTHPHTLQPCELLKNEEGEEMLVYYSIGNYISAQSESSCCKGGMAEFIVTLTPEGYKIKEYTLQPLVISRKADGGYLVEM